MTSDTRAFLDSIRIASPCTADWNEMTGDDRRRFCSECKLHVHDLSAMTTDEALDLLRAEGEGRVCVRLHRRADGRVLTQDCPKGLRRRLRAMWTRAAALAMAMFTAGSCARGRGAATDVPTTPTVQPEPVRMGEVEMGDVAVPKMGKPALPPAPGNEAKAPEVEMGKVAPGSRGQR